MKKNRIALAIILIILVMTLVLTLVACGDTTGSTDQSGNGDFVVTGCAHNIVIDEAVPATCTKTGLTEGEHCSKCGEVLLAQTEVSATGHSPAKAVQENVVEATCTSTGSYYSVVYCDTCGEEISREKESIDVLDHNIVNHQAQEPTCTEVGWEAYETCSRCDYTTYTEIPATGHSPLDAVKENEIAPNCKREGSYDSVVYCDTCGNELSRETIVVPTLGHDIVEHNAQAPTCTEIGWNAYVTCSRCSYSTYVEIPATGHDHVPAVTVPTCTEKGYTTYTCHCGDTYVADEVDALDHNIVNHNAQAPTCTKVGWNAYETCSRCGYSTYVEIPATGHTYDNTCDTICNICEDVRTIEHTYSSDCDTVCNVCPYERVPSASHSYDNSCDTTCNDCGAVRTIEHTYANNCDASCNICGATRTPSSHVYTNNCDTSCNECGAIRKIEHTYSSDCDIICNVCGATRRTATAHSDVNPADNSCDNCGASVSTLTFTLSDDGQSYAITGVSSSISGDITIPSTYNGKPVTTIGSYAFDGCTGLTSVTFGENSQLTTIGDYAFCNCRSLTSVTIGDSVTTIGSYAFAYCDSLTSVTTGENSKLTTIGGRTFYACTGLTSATIGNSVTTIGYEAFHECTSLTSIVIPDSVTTIGEFAFSGCTSLTNVTFGANSQLTAIGYEAFSGCTSLTSIVIPDSVTTIGSSAFEGCRWLKSVTFGENSQLTTIYSSVFSGCSSLTSVTFGANSQLTSIGDQAFYNCTSLTSIVIPDSVTTIGSEAFYNCYKLVEVYNKSSLNITKGSSDYGYVGYYALNVYAEEGGSKLSTDKDGYIIYTNGADKILVGYVGEQTDLIIPDGIKEIYKYAFNSCTSLTSITIPDSVTTIGWHAFRDCTSLIDVYYTGDIAGWCGISFGSSYANPMYHAENLYIDGKLVEGDLIIPDSVTTIGSSAFYYCTSLTSIVIPNSVTTIGDYTFEGCTSLTSITIPDSVTTIGSSAFRDCDSLTSIVIPDSVTTIGSFAFYSCNSLTSIVIPDRVTTIGDYAFVYCTSLTSITIPDSVTTIGDYAFQYCSSLTSVTIGDSVTSIGSWAFWGCSSLTYVYYTGTTEQWEAISIGACNDPLTNATRRYYSECIHDNNHWRYDADGNISTELTVGEWVVDTEPTCTTNGSKHTTCSVCDETVTLEIPALGHSAGDDGLCTVCGEEILYTITNDATYAFVETDGVLQSTNHADNSSSSYVITAYKTITITFEYNVSSESSFDEFYIYHNTTEKVVMFGTSNSYTSYSITLNAGDTLTFKYTKDGSSSSGDDCCYIKNLTITPVNN